MFIFKKTGVLALNKRQTGLLAEKAVAKEYIKKGYKLLEQNYVTRTGEIDLILKKNDMLVFCEVKARSENALYSGRQAVTISKQRKIISAVKNYLYKINDNDNDSFIRFDVAEVLLVNNKAKNIEIIENAFTL